MIILFHPLNTLFSFNFKYLQRANHIQEYQQLINDPQKNKKICILPFIEKEVIEHYKTKVNIISSFTYFVQSEEEKKIIEEEHQLLNLDKFYSCKFLTKDELIKSTDNIIFISEEPEDFKEIVDKENIIKIANWMIYSIEDNYLNYQQRTIPLLSYNNKPRLYDLIIEAFRQINPLVKYLNENVNKKSFKELNNEFFKDALNVVYVLDTDSTSKLYRKREFAQSNPLLKYHPFLNKYFEVDQELLGYPPIDIWLQRIPYYYQKNEKFALEKIQDVIDKHPDILQLHSIRLTERLFDRYEVFKLLSDFLNKNQEIFKKENIQVKIPMTIDCVFDDKKTAKENAEYLKEVALKNNYKYPFLLKTINCGVHEMKLIINDEGLYNIFNDEKIYKEYILKNRTFIIQEFITHGGVMVKNYSINNKCYSFIRPSLPTLSENVLSIDEFAKGNLSFLNEDMYKKRKPGLFIETEKEEEKLKQVLSEKFKDFDKISTLFIESTGISFYGLDFLYDFNTGLYYILEVNYFPSYRELGDKIVECFAEHMKNFHNKFKCK